MQQSVPPASSPVHYLSPRLEARRIPHKGGMGVFTRAPVGRGDLLAIWGGRVIPVEEVRQVSEALRHYVIQIEEGLFLTPSDPTEPAEYFNHSCDPSAGLSGQIALVAMRDIGTGEEVCFDYAMSDCHPLFDFDCECGSPLCRGRVGAEDWRDPVLQQRYAGYFSPYLQRRIDALHQEAAAAASQAAVAVQAVRRLDTRRVAGWRGRARAR